MKQTAVEYLVSKIASKIDNEHWSNQQDITEYVEQAKAMEKEQIVDFVDNLIVGMSREKIEQYYNETFKQD